VLGVDEEVGEGVADPPVLAGALLAVLAGALARAAVSRLLFTDESVVNAGVATGAGFLAVN